MANLATFSTARLIRHGRRASAVLVLACLGLGIGASVALGHAELLVAAPAPNATLADPPVEVRLAFTEPVEAGFSTIDVTAADGTAVIVAAGVPDPTDGRVLIAALPPIEAGSYRVVWRALSAVDGHADVGTYTFTVASAAPSAGPTPAPPPAVAPVTGHHSTLETQGRILLYGGVLLAFGLAICAWLVLDPALGAIPPRVVTAIGVALVVAGVGTILMLLASGLGLPGPTGRPDLVGFATSSRPGALLVARLGLAFGGGIAVLALVRRGRIEPATDVGALVATAVLALTVGAGHAAVFEPPLTIGVWFVHAAAAGIWLAGIALIAVLASQREAEPGVLRSVLLRYSALALVAVALFVATGAYQAWLETGGLPAIDDPYGRLLIVKVAVVGIALVLGLANYLEGDRPGGRLGGLARRATVEVFLAAVAIVVTASLVAIPPPGPGRPIELAAVPPSPDSAAPVRLAIGPGRPGPNRFTALSESVTSDASEPMLLRLVDAGGTTRELPFRDPVTESDGAVRVADVLDLGAGGWAATVLLAPAGVPATASVPGGTFAFTLSSTGIVDGQARRPVDLGLVIGFVVLVCGIAGLAWARVRGRLPRTDPATARIALTGGGLTAVVTGLLMMLLAPLGS